MKSVRIQSFSRPYFPAFGMNTERYAVSLRIQSECRKHGPEIRELSPNTRTFYAAISNNFFPVLFPGAQERVKIPPP